MHCEANHNCLRYVDRTWVLKYLGAAGEDQRYGQKTLLLKTVKNATPNSKSWFIKWKSKCCKILTKIL